MIPKTILPIFFCLAICFSLKHTVQGQLEDTISNDVFLLLDNSGSMRQNDPGFLMRKVGANLLDELDNNTRLGIISFDTKARVLMPLALLSSVSEKQSGHQGLSQIDYNGALTNIPAAFERAIYELKTQNRPEAEKAIIFVTDGYIDTGDKQVDQEKRKWLLESLIPEAENAGIKVFGVAFTENADFQLIQEITAQTHGAYFRAFSPEEIQPVFQKIQNLLAEMGPEQSDAAPDPSSEENVPQGRGPGILVWIGGGIALLLLGGLAVARFQRKRPDASTSGTALQPPGTNNFVPPAKLIDLDRVSDQEVFTITKENTSIGRNEHNDLHLSGADKTVTGYNHAQIIFRDNSFFLKDLSSNFTTVNGAKLTKREEIELNSGDTIGFVHHQFRFELPEDSGQTVIVSQTEPSSDTGTVILEDEKDTFGEENNPVREPESLRPSEPETPTQESSSDEDTGPSIEPPHDQEGDEPEDQTEDKTSSNEDETGETGITTKVLPRGKEKEPKQNPDIKTTPEDSPSDESGGSSPSSAEEGIKPGDESDPELPKNPPAGGGDSGDSTSSESGGGISSSIILPKCQNHPNREAEEVCIVCIKSFCEDCLTTIDGDYVCADCEINMTKN